MKVTRAEPVGFESLKVEEGYLFSLQQQQVSETALRNPSIFIIKFETSCVGMSEDEVRGKGKQIKGKVREEVGKLTNNKKEQVKGKIEQAEGKAREKIGKAERKNKSKD